MRVLLRGNGILPKPAWCAWCGQVGLVLGELAVDWWMCRFCERRLTNSGDPEFYQMLQERLL